jgi:hypothetical protein
MLGMIFINTTITDNIAKNMKLIEIKPRKSTSARKPQKTKKTIKPKVIIDTKTDKADSN